MKTKRKHVREYTVEHYTSGVHDNKKKEKTVFVSLKEAREFALNLYRLNKFISLTNIKGVTLTL